MDRRTALSQLLRPVVEGLGYEFWGLELLGQGHNALLRIYIENSEAGINVEDCAKVSRQISALLDVEDPLESRYTLEVSSPGWDRPLFETSQYLSCVGEVIEVRLLVPFEGRRRYRGQLLGVEDNEARMLVDSDEISFPIEAIDRARVVPQY